jgi:myo-inositol-1(or 4)-monophosphatase
MRTVSVLFACQWDWNTNGRLHLGVIYDPIRDEMFSAERGEGASLNGKRIQVSRNRNLSSALLCTGFPYDVRERSEFARHFTNFIMNAQGVRRDGAAASTLRMWRRAALTVFGKKV